MSHLPVLALILVPQLWSLAAEGPATTDQAPLQVAIRYSPPFVFPESGDEPVGFSIDLWRRIAEDIGRPFEFVHQPDFAALLKGVANGRYDVGIAGITATAKREQDLDFTHSHFVCMLDILVPMESTSGWLSYPAQVLGYLFRGRPAVLLGALGVLVVLAGHALWLSERSIRGTHFSHGYLAGVSEGVYWAIVTASTVGYGDKTAISALGRTIACLTIIIALPLFGMFTAEMASAFTVEALEHHITAPEHLRGRRVGVIEGTTSVDVARDLGAVPVTYTDWGAMIGAIDSGDYEAVIFDQPVLQWYALEEGAGKVRLVDHPFEPQPYGLALGQGSPLREPINQAVLHLYESGEWQRLHQRWLGD